MEEIVKFFEENPDFYCAFNDNFLIHFYNMIVDMDSVNPEIEKIYLMSDLDEVLKDIPVSEVIELCYNSFSFNPYEQYFEYHKNEEKLYSFTKMSNFKRFYLYETISDFINFCIEHESFNSLNAIYLELKHFNFV